MKYLPTKEYPGLPQGDYSYTPTVEGFGPYLTPQLLAADINAWYLTVLPVPSIRWYIVGVEYQSSQRSNNVIHYTALVRYVIITNI